MNHQSQVGPCVVAIGRAVTLHGIPYRMKIVRQLEAAEIHLIRIGCEFLYERNGVPFPRAFFDQPYEVVSKRLCAVYRNEDLGNADQCLALVRRAIGLFRS